MGAPLRFFLSRLLKRGNVDVEQANGVVTTFGDGTGPALAVKLMDRAAERELMLDSALSMGELYMDGRLVITRGDLYDLLELGARNVADYSGPSWIRLIEEARIATRRFHQRNDRVHAKRNIAHHYDLDARFYSIFLDRDMQYSCGYFEHPDDSLEDAQLAKKRHIAAKMLVDDGHNVLDIGCGFGGMALYLAEIAGAKAVGVTLSQEQHAVATKRAAQSGLAQRAQFRLQDYRDVAEKFDRIVSVGMFEHVGAAAYDEYFTNVKRLLKDDGVMLLHSIGRSAKPNATNPWIEKYIFPGGYIPSLSEVYASIERVGLYVTDTEILRLHYAETLKAWRQRFLARRDEVREMYDERFCRMWDFYLAGAESSFRVDAHMVFQIQLTKSQSVVPLTRDYIGAREAALRAREQVELPVRLAGE
jgi:cyclopropane-fatty-acyl-phospholipid synthase